MQLSTLLTTALVFTTSLALADTCRNQCQHDFDGLEWDGSCGASCAAARAICEDSCRKRLSICQNNCAKLFPCNGPHDDCHPRNTYDYKSCGVLCAGQAKTPASCEEQCDLDWSRGKDGDETGAPGVSWKDMWEICRAGCKDKQS